MTYTGLAPSPRPEAIQQPPAERFSGQIDNRLVLDGYNEVRTPILTTELGKHDRVLIPGDAGETGAFGFVYGMPINAWITLGKHNSEDFGGVPDSVLIAKVTADTMTPDMRAILGKASKSSGNDYSAEHDPLYVMTIGDENTPVESFTVIKPGLKDGDIGRTSNNMDWFRPDGERVKSRDGLTTHNGKVSRVQFSVSHHGHKGVLIQQESERSDTVVRTVATDNHKQILATNEAMAQARERSTKKPIHHRLAARILRRHVDSGYK